MYGFYIYINLNEAKSADIKDVSEEKTHADTIKFENYSFDYKKFNKFHDDKVFAQNDQYIIGLDGVILNLNLLQSQFATKDLFKIVVQLFEKEKIRFVSNLQGVFSGFVFKKKTKELYFFNDKTATKQVFYSKYKSTIHIAPTIAAIVSAKEKLNLSSSMNIPAMYNMLTFGGMIEDETLVDSIYKLGAGDYLTAKDGTIKVAKYFDFNGIDYAISNKRQAIDKLNDAFLNALMLEYDKDAEYGYKHLATLSGGLDSRMNVMLADEIGFQIKTFCFSQPDYADEKIARNISDDLGLEFQFISLDDGNYLKSLAEMVTINSGLQFYHGSAHYHFALQQMDIDSYGLMHTGQIGDGILGGFVTKGDKKNYLSQTVSDRFKEKISIDKNVLDKYANEEVFKLYQRVFNLANYGSYMVEHHKTYLVSPFFNEEVIKVALSIDPSLKYNQKIYLDWINDLHPEVSKYIWERTGFRPNYPWKTSLSRYTNKLKKEFYTYTGQKDKLSMNPLEFWLKTNKSIASFYSNFYESNIHLMESNKEVYDDLKLLFETGNFNEKALVLTILEVVRKFNLKV